MLVEVGRGWGRGAKLCIHCGGTNHTMESCYDLHGFPQAHLVATSEDVKPLSHTVDTMVTISAKEYQYLVSNQVSSSIATLKSLRCLCCIFSFFQPKGY